MAQYWSNDADETGLLTRYIIDNKHYAMWAIQIQDNRHEFHVVTEDGLALGAKRCTLHGPTYFLFDEESAEHAHVAPNFVPDHFRYLDAGVKEGNPGPVNGRRVEFQEFRISILRHLKRKTGNIYCCSAKAEWE